MQHNAKAKRSFGNHFPRKGKSGGTPFRSSSHRLRWDIGSNYPLLLVPPNVREMILQSDVEVQAVDPPLPPPQQTPQPLQSQSRPLHPRPGRLVHRGRCQCADRCVEHVESHRRRTVGPFRHGCGAGAVIHSGVNMCRSRVWFLRLEPVAADVEEAPVGPVTRRQEEDDEQKGAVDAWSVEEVCADEEDENEGRRRVGRYEEQWEPTTVVCFESWSAFSFTRFLGLRSFAPGLGQQTFTNLRRQNIFCLLGCCTKATGRVVLLSECGETNERVLPG